MLSIGRMSSAAGAANYLVKGGEGHTAGYYKEEQPHSKWGGGAKEVLGLADGPVDLKTLERLLDGRISETKTLGRMVNNVRQRDFGRDFTFSVAKSVSLAATGELEKPILGAVTRAADTAMDYYQANFAQARVWDNEAGKQVKVGDQKILYASFLDYVSRANDPNIHVHNALVNIAIGADGKIRSQDFSLGYQNKILLGSIFRAELAKEMQKLGFQIRPAGKNGLWELAGSQDEILRSFSKRRVEMERQAPHKVSDPKAMAKIALTTRPVKEAQSKEGLITRWNSELRKLGSSSKAFVQSLLESPAAHSIEELTAKSAIDYALAFHSENERHFDKYKFLKTAMTRVYGHVDIKTMEAELEQRLARDQIRESKDGRWLIPTQALKTEKAILNEMDKGHLQGRVLTKQSYETLTGLGDLSPGQLNGAKLLLTCGHRLIGIDGTAGTGKSYMLSKTLRHLKAMGYELVGIAPSHKALSGLKKTGVFDKTFTVQAFEKSPYGHSKTVLVMDEAGMVGSRTMRTILNFANAKKMPRIALIGDPNQLAPIEAGRPFADLLENGLRSVHMDDIIRQKSKRHRQGVKELSRGEISEAFQTLQKEIYETAPEKLIDKALALHQSMDNPTILVSTNKDRELINQRIKTQKENMGAGVTLKTWHPVHLNTAEKKLVQNYETATHIKFFRDVGKTFKRGEIYKIEKLDIDKARVVLSRGNKTCHFSPARHGSGDSFTKALRGSEITLHQGDQIKFKHTDRRRGVSNNDFGTVNKITGTQVQIKLENNKTLALPHGDKLLEHIDYGWANTVHSFQGATVKNTIAIMRADHNPLTTLQSLYVGASRHEDKLAIITDSKDNLLDRISEKLEFEREKIEFKEPGRMTLIGAPYRLQQHQEKKSEHILPHESQERSRGDRSR